MVANNSAEGFLAQLEAELIEAKLQNTVLQHALDEHLQAEGPLRAYASVGLVHKIAGHAILIENPGAVDAKRFLGCLNTICAHIVDNAINIDRIDLLSLLKASSVGLFTDEEWVCISRAALALYNGQDFGNLSPYLPMPIPRIEVPGQDNQPFINPLPEPDYDPPQVSA